MIGYFTETMLDSPTNRLPNCPDMGTAQLNAAIEAAATGSTVMRVRAIESRDDGRVLFIGAIPADCLQAAFCSTGRPSIRPRGLGKLYTTTEALTSPSEPLGFLVLHHPVKLISGEVPEDGEFVAVALEAPRPSVSFRAGLIGPVCCSHCNEPISELRLRVVPGVKVCTNCQHLKEKTK